MATRKSGRKRRSREPAALPTRYLESSALVAAFLEADVGAREALRAPGRRISSALTLTEAHRALLRARNTGRLTADDQCKVTRGLRTSARRSAWVAVSDEVLTRAGRAFPVEPIRTLDAIHLATVEWLGEPPTLHGCNNLVASGRKLSDAARLHRGAFVAAFPRHWSQASACPVSNAPRIGRGDRLHFLRR